ncbi:lysylphosphatidylglycerol synthase domain-containing protein [Actinokineospora sp. PR83]|uniref:lysylphosphatidylglycerol synthase domain-containing protein n=1 Tax=Actinokineospora sp. PR83 TaxID=2884908 RepID=UPI0027DF9342|nr:lysylphosphatidylglycerol synthase domain-containing protein [Actinokineospora sp. PR83]MCG8917590.1 lysylphosphatidylglycerol synthase domain-containing protein [Actinokineospora sp. PR83]
MAEGAGRRSRAADVLTVGFVLLAVGVAGWALRDDLPALGAAIGTIGWWRAAGAFALVVLGLLATAQVWRRCLDALGHPVGWAAARAIFFPAQVGKYLPGAVWPLLAQARFARRYGVPAHSALLAGAVFLAVHVVTSVVVSAGLLFADRGLLSGYGWAGLAAVLVLPLLHPRVVTAVVRRLGGDAGLPALTWSALLRPMGWMVPAWLAYGAAGLVAAAPFTGATARLGGLATSGFALSWLVGLVVVFAPAGLGAREAVLVLVLGPVLGVVAATAVGLLLRACHTVADMGLALVHGVSGGSRSAGDRGEGAPG